jgi:Immunity protein 50
MNVEEAIGGYEKLKSVFGRWPSFHDSEVLWIRLDRRRPGEGYGPTLDALIHVFQMTSEIGQSGAYILRHHSLAHFRFHDVVELRLEEFNCQNVLWELAISDIRERQMERIHFQVDFVPSFGVSASFQCHLIELLGVTPCTGGASPQGDEARGDCHL